MVSKKDQDQFKTLVYSKLSSKEQEWINDKISILSSSQNNIKFGVFFSLVSRFISTDNIEWNTEELLLLNTIYPGFSYTNWSKQNLVRAILMISLYVSTNKSILIKTFQMAEMKELVALYKGLFFLENASDFKDQVAEGIRTNMTNVFMAIIHGNPFAQKYLDQGSWNQMILKTFFMNQKIHLIQNVDQGKNEHLANMLQDYIKERWAANRDVSFEIWRMIDGFLRDDIKELIETKALEGTEKEITSNLIQNKTLTVNYWNKIGNSL